MTDINQLLAEKARKLKESYHVGGRETLRRMTKGERALLLSEFQIELNIAAKRLAAHPHDEVGILRKEKLEIEIGEIANGIRECEKNRGLDRER